MGFLQDFKFGTVIVKRNSLYDNQGNISGLAYTGGSSVPVSCATTTCRSGRVLKRVYNRTNRTLSNTCQCVKDLS